MRRLTSSLTLLALTTAQPAAAGGYLKVLDRTGQRPSSIPGQVLAEVRPIRWDDRCIPSLFTFNVSQDPIPNPLGPPVLSAAAAQAALAQAFATWREVPTAYSDVQLTGTTTSELQAGFDMVNEVTFRPPSDFNAAALTRSIVLLEDSILVVGQDLDGDGDSDVVGSAVCGDADGDGDLEFPAGSYRAGTILDADILFNSEDFRFTVGEGTADVISRSLDLLGVATHESGHAQGLAHTLDNQLSAFDGTSSTMYPTIDTTDPADELALRTLSDDDIATLSAHYPEGSRGTGPGALQPGDVPFSHRYGFLSGEVRSGSGSRPVAGASVAAENVFTGRLAASAWSGRVQVSIDPATNSATYLSESRTILDGAFRIPVPLGLYRLRIEGADGAPVLDPAFLTPTEQAGAFFGQLSFGEEFYNGPREGARETEPGAATPVFAVPGLTVPGVTFTTNREDRIFQFNALTSARFTDAAPGTYYAVRIPGAEVLARAQGHHLDLHAVDFFTLVADASTVPMFAEALLTTGSIAGTTAAVDVERPLARRSPFVGQDFDFASFYLPNGAELGEEVIEGLEEGDFEDLFLVLRVPTSTPFPGINALPPLIGASRIAPLALRSYRSSDGVTFTLVPDLDFMFRLVTEE